MIGRKRLAEIIAEKMGHERSDDSPECFDADGALGCRHANGHPAIPGCDTCCEYGWPCKPSLAAADAVLAVIEAQDPYYDCQHCGTSLVDCSSTDALCCFACSHAPRRRAEL
jgi:hypothetical protein